MRAGRRAGTPARTARRSRSTRRAPPGGCASAEYLWPARSRQEVLVSSNDFGVLFAPESLLGDLPASTVTRQALFAYAPGADRASVDARLEGIARRYGASDALKPSVNGRAVGAG